MPIDVRRCMRIEWSIVSNTEKMSSSARIIPFLLSRLVRISLDFFASEVSVDLKEDMRFGRGILSNIK